MERELRQGELLSGVIHHSHAIDRNGNPGLNERIVDYVLLATQDCDLYRDHQVRASGKSGVISGVLMFEARDADTARKQLNISSKEWNQIKNNVNERFQFLSRVLPEGDLSAIGLPDLLVDFKRYFTILPDELERQIKAGSAKRRVRLNTLHRERVQGRAAFFLQRIALPDDYES